MPGGGIPSCELTLEIGVGKHVWHHRLGGYAMTGFPTLALKASMTSPTSSFIPASTVRFVWTTPRTTFTSMVKTPRLSTNPQAGFVNVAFGVRSILTIALEPL